MYDVNSDTTMDVPDEVHFQKMMIGLHDSITGNEGLGLTKAQVYVQGALYASGETRSLQLADVAGNEGLLSGISNAVKKTWDYIVKMLKAIWDWLTGKDVKAQETEVKDKVKTAEESIKQVEAPKVTTANVTAVVKKIDTKVNKLPEGPEKKKLEAQVVALKEGEATSAKASEAVAVIKEVFNASVHDDSALERLGKDLEASIKKLEDRKAVNDGIAKNPDYKGRLGDVAEGLSADIQTLLNGLNGLDRDVASIKDVSTAKAFIAKGKRCVEAMGNNLENVKSSHEALKKKQQKVVAMLNSGADTKGNDELSQELSELNLSVVCSLAIIAAVKSIWGCIGRISDALEEACVTIG